jgi:hypothetical protein
MNGGAGNLSYVRLLVLAFMTGKANAAEFAVLYFLDFFSGRRDVCLTPTVLAGCLHRCTNGRDDSVEDVSLRAHWCLVHFEPPHILSFNLHISFSNFSITSNFPAILASIYFQSTLFSLPISSVLLANSFLCTSRMHQMYDISWSHEGFLGFFPQIDGGWDDFSRQAWISKEWTGKENGRWDSWTVLYLYSYGHLLQRNENIPQSNWLINSSIAFF